MDDRTGIATPASLRFVLNVLEENSHLGLDDEMAERMRKIIVRRIAVAEDSLAGQSMSSFSRTAGFQKVSA